jgi:two-component system sensor histidine kinase BarA
MASIFPTELFLFGALLGGLFVLAIYNSALFLTFRNFTPLIFLVHVLGIMGWLVLSSQQLGYYAIITQPLGTILYRPEFILLFLLTSGLTQYFILHYEHGQFVSKLAVQYCVVLGTLLLCIVLLTLLDSHWPTLSLIVTVLGMALGSVALAMLALNRTTDFSSVKYLCFSAVCLPLLLFAIEVSDVFLAKNIDIHSIFSIASVTFVQVILFTVAMNAKDKKSLLADIAEMTQDLSTNLEMIEAQNVRLDSARKDAQKANHIKSRFLANISHEIRTPLNAIVGFSRELQTLELSRERKEQIDIINKSAQNLTSLVNDVLDFSQIEAGKFKIKNNRYEPNQVFEDVVDVYAKSAQLKQLECIYSIGNIPKQLQGDSLRLQQVLNNLLNNAIKFTLKGQIELHVSGYFTQPTVYMLQICVIDSGVGIATSQMNKLFQPFSQVEDAISRQFQGSGLGLVICDEIVKRLDGNITLSSEPGIGTQITIQIPQQVETYEHTLFEAKSPLAGKSVLIIDSVPSARRATAKLCDAMGMSVFAYESPQYCRHLQQKFDYILISLPQRNSHHRGELLTQITQFSAENAIFMYSGNEPDFGDYQIAQQQHTMSLPLTLSKLITTISTDKEFKQNPMQRRLDLMPKLEILAVDDIPLNLKLLVTWLKDSPLHLTQATSGEEALQFAQQHEYDLILMDIQMPGMDGIAATKAIRKTQLNIGTPIVALTAHAFKQDREQFLNSGFDDFIPKPIDLNLLLDIISLWCKQDHIEFAEGSHRSQEVVSGSTQVLDWELALRRANYNHDAARHMLAEFVKMLPSMLQDLDTHFAMSRTKEVHATVHKLHGACCYTGVPVLQATCAHIETQFRLNLTDELTSDLEKLKSQAEEVSHAARELLQKITHS